MAPTVDPQQARLYAQCMRDNGVPDFPDPDANGRFSGLSHEKANDPKFQAAVEKCRTLAPGGEHEKFGDPIFVAQVRAYSQCMRANGVPDFPDPDADGDSAARAMSSKTTRSSRRRREMPRQAARRR